MKELPIRLLAILAGVVLLILAVGLTVRSCDKRHSLNGQTKVDLGQAGAFANSSADAIQTIGNSAARERTSDDLSRTNEQEIRNAPGANQAVDPGARDAGLRSLCRRAAYRDDPKCRVLGTPAG